MIRAEGGENGRINIDHRYMHLGTCLSNAGFYMPAMRPMQERAAVLTEKYGPARGESGARGRGTLWLPRRGTDKQRKGGTRPVVSPEQVGAFPRTGKGGPYSLQPCVFCIAR